MAKKDNIGAILNEDMMLDIDDGTIEPFEIDTDAIDAESRSYADSVIQNIAKLYGDEEYLNKNPKLKIRLGAELETLRRNYKMCAIDEIMFDKLANAVGQNTSNAALWIAYARHQSTIMSLQSKIDTSIDRITKLIDTYRNVQTEMTFNSPAEESGSEDIMARGTKAFMAQVQNIIENSEDENEETE